MRRIDCLLIKLETEPDNVDIYFDLAEAYGQEKNQTEAKSIIIRLLNRELSLEDWGDAKRWLGFLYYGENDLCAAIEIARELLEVNINAYNTGQAHHLMGVCLLEKGHEAEQTELSEQYLAEAVQHLEQALELVEAEGEDRAEILWAWGIELRLQERFKEAIDALNSALRMVPSESRMAGVCHEQLGLAYYGLQEYEKVVLHLEEAVQILLNSDPYYSLAQIYANLSRVYVWLRQYDKALADAKRSLEAASRSKENRKSQLAVAHQACGDAYYYGEFDLSLAQKHYKEYLGLLDKEITDRAQTLIKLADIERLRGKYKRALEDFKKALALGASGIGNSIIYSAMGECAYNLENFEEAIKAYTSAIEYIDDDKEAVARGFLCLGHSLFELKRYKEAADAYREGLKYVDPKTPERAELMKYLVAANELKDH